MKFELDAECIIDEEGEEPEKSIYNIGFNVKLLKTDDDKAVIYDKDLKMYFENPSGIRYIYEVETKDVNLSLTKRLRKGQDIDRRLFYRYDWIQFRVNRKGQIFEILNRNELHNSWNELKNNIFEHYKGPVLECFIERMDNDYAAGYEPERSVNQYLHFGLLFPGIPFEHHNEWNKARTIRCSEYETARFEENIAYQKTEDKLRYYAMSGWTQEGSRIDLVRYEGTVYVPENDIFPQNTKLAIEYVQGIRRISWNFTLKRK